MSTRGAGALCVLAILLSGLVWLPSLDGEYIYDDHRFVERNPAVQEGVDLFEYFAEPATQTFGDSWEGLYRPVRTLSYRIVRLMGDGPGTQRAANLVLHLLNAVLVWLLLGRILDSRSGLPPLLGALAFSIHPLAAESVAWISSRGDLLALAGVLGALLFHLRRSLSGTVCCFALALLSKESAAILPALLLLIDGVEGGWSRVKERWQAYAAAVVTLVAIVVLRREALPGALFAQAGGLGLGTLDLSKSLLVAAAYYVRDLVLPLWTAFEVSPPVTAPLVLIGALLVIGLPVAAFLARRRARWLTLGFLWIPVALIPVTVLQFLFPLKIVMASRFAYPAIVGCSILLTGVAGWGGRTLVPVGLILASMVPLTLSRASVYHDERSLWSAALLADPHNARALSGLGAAELRSGDLEAAHSHLRQAAELVPTHPGLLAALGRVCWERAWLEKAGSKERSEFLIDSCDAYTRASMLWYRGAQQDRHLYRLAALRGAWLWMPRERPRMVQMFASEVMSERTGLPVNDRTLGMLRDLVEYLGPEHPVLGKALAAEAYRLQGEMRK